MSGKEEEAKMESVRMEAPGTFLSDEPYPIYHGIYIRNYLIWSVINFVLFSWNGWQVSSLSLVFSLITQDAVREEKYEKAKIYSKLALIFNILSLLKGLIIYPAMSVYFIYKNFF